MYAIRNDLLGWRTINSIDDLLEGEHESNEIPAEKPLLVTRITRAQGKKHLLATGNYTAVKSAIDSENSSEAMRIGFYDEEYWLINDSFVLAAAAMIGWNGEQLQHEFNEAAKL